jgi:dihydroorotase
MAESLILPSASDFHIHLRQDDLMNMVVPRIAEGGVSLCYVMVLKMQGKKKKIYWFTCLII